MTFKLLRSKATHFNAGLMISWFSAGLCIGVIVVAISLCSMQVAVRQVHTVRKSHCAVCSCLQRHCAAGSLCSCLQGHCAAASRVTVQLPAASLCSCLQGHCAAACRVTVQCDAACWVTVQLPAGSLCSRVTVQKGLATGQYAWTLFVSVAVFRSTVIK